MEAGVKELQDFISRPVDYSASVEQLQGYFYYLRGTASAGLYRWLQPHEYTGVLTLAALYGRRSGLTDDALLFLDQQYPDYSKIVQYDYYNKSTLLFQWAALLEKKGRDHEALEMVKKATLYNLTDNVSYTGYEFLSFRGCTKYVFSEIADETLSLMHPTEFNDPMDTVLLQWMENQIKQGAAGFESQKEALKNLRVRCFTRTAKLPRDESSEELLRLRKHQRQDVCKVSPLMWAHYADNHKGICIKYKFNSEQFPLVNNEENEIFRMGNLDYKRTFSINFMDISVNDALFAKSKVWQYEHETRLVYYSINDVPKVKIIKVPGAITGIYLGLRCSDEDERIIKALINQRTIPIYRMYTDTRNVYQLRAKEI